MASDYYTTSNATWDSGTATLVSPTVSIDGYTYINGDLTVTGKIKEENMRGLFEVFVIDPKKGEIVVSEKTIAKSEQDAKLKVLTKSKVNIDLDKMDVHAFCYGMFVRERKEVQKVKMVESEDE